MIFKNWPEKLQGNRIFIIKTKPEHLGSYISWHKWEGSLDITEEEATFANQRNRVRRLKLIKNYG